MRCIHEASLYELGHGSCFVTLTYRDEDVPEAWSLTPAGDSDFQKFIRRLRKKTEQKIRYFMVGEYGTFCRHSRMGVEVLADNCEFCCVGRPHYHAILFNRTFSDAEVCGRRGDIFYYTSKELEKIWGLGIVQIGEVNVKTAAYTARYCLKKVTGQNAPFFYQNLTPDGEIFQVQPEYATMSRRPGIGADWFKKYKSDCFPSDEVPVSGWGVIPKVPRYYADIFEVDNPETLEEVKRSRKRFRDEHVLEYTPERLMEKYKVKKRQVEFLKREMT